MNARVVFLGDPQLFFQAVKKYYADSWSQVATVNNISTRTLASWRARETSLPLVLAQKWSALAHVPIPRHTVISLDQKRKIASSLGAIARLKLYGNFGTKQGRKLGGFHGLRTHKRKKNSPFVAQDVLRPERNEALAEMVGAVLGDGMITPYQLVLYSNLKDDFEYADFLFNLVVRVFSVRPSIVKSEKQNVIKIIVSRKNLIKRLKALHLTPGSKVKKQAGVPGWIERNRKFRKACVRGLIDTDGCVYFDKHTIKGRVYSSICIAFTSASIPLLDFVEESLKREGFKPTRWGRNIRLRKREEVMRYAKEIGFSNPKHARKIRV